MNHADPGAMTMRALIAAINADRGLGLSDEQLADAAVFLNRFRNELATLRAVQLEFLPPYVEPQTAVRWIEDGGHTRSQS
jgi:hypothetical protein